MTEAPTKAVVIGASAGAVQALLHILPALPRAYPMPVLIVVHVPPDRENALVSLFSARCQMKVKEAEDKEEVSAGVIYFAPSDYHLLVEASKALSLSLDAEVNYSRPSIDVLFESSADAFGSGLIGVILTGANQDGADGLKAIASCGGRAVVEDPATAYAPVMPSAALAACTSARAMTLDGIVTFLRDQTAS